METRIMGGFEVKKPTSVMALERVLALIEKEDIEGAKAKCRSEIEQRWAIDGYWANVTLQEIY